MKRVLLLLSVASSACLTTVEERWCDSQTPCGAGFICTPTFHCIPGPRTGGGAGGGGAIGGGSGGGATGGGSGGGLTGGGSGGGGGTRCNAGTCVNGCCSGGTCIPFALQSTLTCGTRGEVCRSCGDEETCSQGLCTAVPLGGGAGGGGGGGGTASAIGGPCTGDTQCGTDGLGWCIPEVSGGQPTGFVGGYCTRDCENDPCPAGSSCIEAESGGGGTIFLCLDQCLNASECRVDYFCDMQAGVGLCLP